MQFNPTLLEIDEQIESERLIIRVIKPGDGASHYPAVKESLPELKKHLAHLPWLKDEPSLANSEKFCRIAYSNFLRREALSYFMFSKPDQRLIGSIGLLRIDWDTPRFEIGYWCRTSEAGKGYVIEAVNAMTDFALNKLVARRVEIRADDDNVRSWKVAQAAGFTLEGTLRNWDRNPATGGLKNLRIYAKIA